MTAIFFNDTDHRAASASARAELLVKLTLLSLHIGFLFFEFLHENYK